MTSKISDIPPDTRRVFRRLNLWRRAHNCRLQIPERLLTAAADLAREHGVFRTAKALQLEYSKLKERLDDTFLRRETY
jgi:2-polyprenyl-6-methoxyphenol hydroxylase-like FAD-dependent oxidoreductase